MTQKRSTQRRLLRTSLLENLERRELLAGDSGPRIVEVGVTSSAWSAGYVEELHRRGLADSDGFVHVNLQEGSVQNLRWTNIDRLKLRFDEPIAGGNPKHLVLTNPDGPIAYAEEATLNADGRELEFNFPASASVDRWYANVDDAIVNLDGVHLDGELRSGTQTGDGRPGGAYRGLFATLPGDATGDGRIGTSDLFALQRAFKSSIGDSRYDVRADFDGSGRIDDLDLAAYVASAGQWLPAAQPAQPQPFVFNEAPTANPQTIDLLEDSTASFSLPVADPDGDALTVVVTQAPVHGALTIHDTSVQYVPDSDYFGADHFSYYVTDGRAYSATQTVDFDIQPVNDAPRVIDPPGRIALDSGQPLWSRDLNSLFQDPESDAMTFRLVDYSAAQLSVVISGTELRLEAIEGVVSAGLVVVEARDAIGASTQFVIDVDINYPHVPLSQLVYVLASDQVIDFHGKNTFVLETNFDRSTRIEVESTNHQIVSPDDVTLAQLGNGRHQVIMRHASNEYGFAFLRFRVEGEVMTEIAVLVLPPAEVTSDATAEPAFEQRIETTVDGDFTIEKVVNDKHVALLVREAVLKIADAFSMLRPVQAIDALVASAVYGAHTEVQQIAPGSIKSTLQFRAQEVLGDATHFPFSNVHFDSNLPDGSGGNRLNLASSETPVVRFARHQGKVSFTETVSLGQQTDTLTDNEVAQFLLFAHLRAEGSLVKGNFKQEKKDLDELVADLQEPELSKKAKEHLEKMLTKYLGKTLTRVFGIVGDMLLDPAPTLTSANEQAYIEKWKLKNADYFTELTKLRNEQVEFNELVEELSVSARIIDGSIPGTTGAIDAVRGTARQLNDLVPMLEGVQEEFSKRVEEGPARVAFDPATIPDADNRYSPLAEALGENGASVDNLHKVVDQATGSRFSLEKLQEVGKKLFDIAKTTKSILDKVDAIFGDTSSTAGNYTDSDGETYNRNTAQRGPNARIGTPGADIINTGIKADEVFAGAGDDQIYTYEGNDYLEGGPGRNSYFAGPGNDEIHDGAGDGFISAGEGDDTIYPGAGNDVIEAGIGHDVIILAGSSIGNNVLIDPSRSGELRFTGWELSELTLRKDRYDLEILAPATNGRYLDSVKFVDFFEQDAAGWFLIDKLGNEYSLYELTGRITTFEVLEVAFKQRSEAGVPVFPVDVVYQETIADADERFKLHVAQDRRLMGDNSTVDQPGLFIHIEGDVSLEGWLARNQFASLGKSNELYSLLTQAYDFAAYSAVTIVGHGEGGLIAQWLGSIAATRSGAFANVYVVNAPDISGLMSQVVRADVVTEEGGTTSVLAEGRPEYSEGFPKLSTSYLVNQKDWVSKIGVWAGYDETYASWKAYDFNYDPLDNSFVSDLLEVELAHAPQTGQIDFAEVQVSELDLSEVRGIVSFMSLNDMLGGFANVEVDFNGETFDSTTNARVVLDGPLLDGLDGQEFDVNTSTAAIRAEYLLGLAADSDAVGVDGAFTALFDFQAREQGREHLAPGHLLVTEATLHTDASGINAYGWESIENLAKGEDRGRASSLERDSVRVKEGTFIVDLGGERAGPGTYNISITVGDREEIQESLQIFINGYQVDRVSTMPGDFLTRSYQVNLLEPELRITFVDMGGRSAYFAVNGVTVEKVNYRGILPISERLEEDPSVTVITQSYELPETSIGIEIYKEALKAAAIAAASAGVGAVLGATSFGTVVAGKMGTTIATSAKASNALIGSGVKTAILGGFKATVGPAIKSSVLGSLKVSISKNLMSQPVGRGSYYSSSEIFKGSQETVGAFEKFLDAVDKNKKLEAVYQGLKTIDKGLSVAKTASGALKVEKTVDSTAPWIYETVNSLATMTQRFELGQLDTGFVPVDLEAVEDAIAAGRSPKQLLRLWEGSRDFLVLDWVPTRETLTEIDVDEHLSYVNRTAKVLKTLLQAYTTSIQESSPETDLDILFVGHGAGHEINRETVNRLNVSDVADALDYVKVVALDPYASSQQAFTWYHPEMTTIVDRVDNIYQTTAVDSSLWLAALTSPIVLIGSDPGGSELYHGGSDIGGLDGREGGGAAGFYNRQGRIFDLASSEEILRFRHWDTNTVELSTAELTDIEFSPDGSLVAASGKDGMVTVRYVDEQVNPVTGEVEGAAGKVKFVVWGQEAIVRSVSFMQMQVDGVWKDYLLTISAARNPNNTDIDKNKVLLTDVETGLPVWQGLDVGGTQVEASPSGNVIVSTDSRGHAKVWKRVEGTVTFEPLPDLVDAHTGPNSDYIADVLVINDQFFVTAGLDGRMKLFAITDRGGRLIQTKIFDNPTEGKVRNLDYDPYNGILAVGAGQELSLWQFNQAMGTLSPFAPAGQQTPPKFSIHSHVDDIQGVAFSKPSFLLDANGRYAGDRFITKADGRIVELPRTDLGDIDLTELPSFLQDNQLPTSYAGLKMVTGGEDKTLFLYALDGLNIGSIREENVLSGAMLPIREVTISPDGRRVAVVGEDNIDENDGGPIKDIDVTAALDDRLGWAFSELFLQGRREHNAVPQQYIYDVVEQKGESFFWLRNSNNANRPGELDKSRNLALPPNKRDNVAAVDIAEMDMYLRPGQTLEILPLQWLLEVNRKDYQVNQATLELGNVVDDDDVVVGSIRLKRSDSGQIRPNIFVFEAADNLDYSSTDKREFVGRFTFDITGPNDLEGNPRVIENAEITFRIINHKPTTHRDIVNLHPNRAEIDLRPRANDYDFDNDDFGIIPVPTSWQTLTYASNGVSYDVARYRRHPDPDRNNGVDIETLVTEQVLTQLLAEQADADAQAGREPRTYIPVEFEYQVREDRYRSVSSGVVEVRLQLQAGPENVRYSELGANRVLIEWEPVSWSANRYIIERYEDGQGWIKHASDSHVDGNQQDSLRIAITPNTDYWFRVVAKNTNTDREHASYEGDDKTQALYVPATDFVGPASVVMEALGPAQVEVRWERVFWNVDRYRIDLHQLVVGENGLPVRNADGTYQYVAGASRFEVVQQGDGLRVAFKRLENNTPYLAVVTAKNAAGTVEEPTEAESPVFTTERQVPAGIELVRVGPERARISWATLSYADRYRVVAVDPHTLERVAVLGQAADNSRNTNDLVLGGLASENDYIIIVEARHAKTKEWITLIDDQPPTPALPDRDVLAEDISPAVSAGISATYIIPASFDHSITVPSLQGLFVNSEFTLLNFASQAVTVIATDGTIGFLDGSAPTQILPPTLGASGSGSVVYRFIAQELASEPGTLYWQVQVGDELSEARVLQTPPFLAAERAEDDGELLKKSPESLPKQLKVDWITPFWDVNRHIIEIFNYNAATGALTPVPGVPSKTLYLSELTGKERTHTFRALTPDTVYMVRLTTIGEGRSVVAEQLLATDDQTSPTGIEIDQATLTSMRVSWTGVSWNVERYRVSFAEIGENGEPDESTRDYRYIPNTDNSTKDVEGLTPGTAYSVTVEAESRDEGWIPNTEPNIKIGRTLRFQLASSVYLSSPSQGTSTIVVDWSNVYSTVDADGFRFGATAATVYWKESGSSTADSQSFGVNRTQLEIDNLSAGADYEVWVEFTAAGLPGVQVLRTENQALISTLPPQAPTVTIDVSSIARHEFAVEWSHVDPQDVVSFTVEVSINGGPWRRTARKVNGVFENRTNIPPGNNGPGDTYRRILEYSRENQNDKWLYFTAGTRFDVRVVADYGDGRSAIGQAAGSVTTLPLIAPSNIHFTDVSHSEIRVNWTQSDASGIEHFNIYKRLTGAANWEAEPVKSRLAAGDRRALITGLDWGTSYEFLVEAVYVTAWSNSEEIRAREAVATASPPQATLTPDVQLIRVRVDGKRQATVFWQAIDPAPSALRIEVQQLVPGQPDDNWSTPVGGNIVSDTTRTSKDIEQLIPGATYRARLIAIGPNNNEVPSGNTIQFTMEAYPAIPAPSINDHTGDSVTVRWTRLEALDGSANVTENRVFLYSGSTLVRTYTTGSGAGNLHSLTANGLAMGATYSVRVVAYNNDVQLSQSSLTQFTTYTPATNVRVTANEWRKLNITWNAPTWTVANYEVLLYKVGNNNPVEIRTPSGSQNFVNIGNLEVGASYYAVVIAKNASLNVAGVRSANSPGGSTYNFTAPVLDSISQPVNSTMITARWTHFAPLESGLTYRLERRNPFGDNLWKTVKGQLPPIFNASAQTTTFNHRNFDNVKKGDTYDFRIVAVYGGRELPSNALRHWVRW